MRSGISTPRYASVEAAAIVSSHWFANEPH